MTLYDKLTATITTLENAGLEGLDSKNLIDLLEEVRYVLIDETELDDTYPNLMAGIAIFTIVFLIVAAASIGFFIGLWVQ